MAMMFSIDQMLC